MRRQWKATLPLLHHILALVTDINNTGSSAAAQLQPSDWHWGLGEGALPIGVAALKQAFGHRHSIDPDTALDDLPGLTTVSEALRGAFLKDVWWAITARASLYISIQLVLIP